jgi:hypothetical protein
MKVMSFRSLAALVPLIIISGCTQGDDLPTDINLHRVILFSEVPLDYRYMKRDVGGECNFERITKELNGDYSVIGWGIPSVSASSVAQTYLISVNTNSSSRFGLTQKQDRSDVADHFKNKQLLNVGFLARFKKSDLQSGSCINIYQIYDKKILKCKNNLLFKEDGIEPCP